MYLRAYLKSDLKEIIDLFYNTVHAVNAKDYTKEQLDAWAPKKADIEGWGESLLNNRTIIAVENQIIIGFGDIEKSGYLNRLFVDKNFQNIGVGTAILNELEKDFIKIFVHSSITALAFFYKKGYVLTSECEDTRLGVSLKYYILEKQK